MYAASSYEARGITPGSVNVVRSNELIVKKYNMAPTIGIIGLIRVAKKGQLKYRLKYTNIVSKSINTFKYK